MTDMLYRWPAATYVGSRIPKEKFYEQGTVSAAVREKFVSEVQRITWAYKLAETTINLRGDDAVPEIQVFQIDCKDDDVSDSVLTAIDKAIPLPIIFEVTRTPLSGDQVRMVATHKLVSGGTPKLSGYYSTGWLPSEAERRTLPTVITLPALLASILEPLTDLVARPGEQMSDVADRLKMVGKLEREIAALERKLRTEPQLNRKFELRRALKSKQHELEQQR
ncbi:DUF4391 domain-containing protein [Propionibacteriaceae bacterium G1746]